MEHYINMRNWLEASKDLQDFPHTSERWTSFEQGAAAEQAIVEPAPSNGRVPEPATPARQYAEQTGPGWPSGDQRTARGPAAHGTLQIINQYNKQIIPVTGVASVKPVLKIFFNILLFTTPIEIVVLPVNTPSPPVFDQFWLDLASFVCYAHKQIQC